MAMNAAATVRRPMGCLKAAVRQLRHQRALARCLATVATLRNEGDYNAPSVRLRHPNPMPAVHKKHIAELDATGARTQLFSKARRDSARVGDVLMVSIEGREPFAGAFIQIRRRGSETAIQLRGRVMKTGVEMWFKIYSPTVTGIDIIWRRPKRARRARLTYMRKPKHDMGNVDHLVMAWKKERRALSARARQSPGSRARV